jgi:thioesterase domain-containing protein
MLDYTRTDIFRIFVELLELAAGQSLEINKIQLDEFNENARLKELHSRMVKNGLMPRRSKPEALRGPYRTFGSALRSRYSPQGSYPLQVHLVLADDRRLDRAADDMRKLEIINGWRQFAPGVSIIRARGDHFTILKPPHVNEWVASWRRSSGFDEPTRNG